MADTYEDLKVGKGVCRKSSLVTMVKKKDVEEFDDRLE